MKKLLKRIFALICILTLATGFSPVSAASLKEINFPPKYTTYLIVGPLWPEGDIHLNFSITDRSGYNTGLFMVYANTEFGLLGIYSEELSFYEGDNFREIVLDIPYSIVRSKSVFISMVFAKHVIIEGNILYYGYLLE